MKILLITGGWSTEREVSLAGAENVATALRGLGHEVTPFDLREEFEQLLPRAMAHDFAFINLHGAPGEDGLPQALLDAVGVPYQGSGPAGSMLALNKATAREVFRHWGLPIAPGQFLAAPPPADWRPALPFPLFVKGNTGGSSVGVARVEDMAQLNGAMGAIFASGDGALLETALIGREVSCGILGDEALPPILIEPAKGDFFTYASKYAAGGAREICPAPIGQELTATVQAMALQAHRALGLRGYSRSDFIIDDAGKITILEVNTLPGLTATSLLPQEAAQAGYSLSELLQELLVLGLQDHPRRSSS